MIWVTWARMVGFDVTLDQNRKFSTLRARGMVTNSFSVDYYLALLEYAGGIARHHRRMSTDTSRPRSEAIGRFFGPQYPGQSVAPFRMAFDQE